MSIKNRSIAADAGIELSKLLGGGFAGAADVRYAALNTGAAFDYFKTRVNQDKLHPTISAAHTAATTGRNDVVLLSPDSHSQASGLTWSKNMTHLIGMYGEARMNQRSRIGHSADFATLLTVSGYGNTFANLYFMHGRGSATNVNLLTLTGHRNSFVNCHFGGPMHQTEGDTAGYDLVRIQSSEDYFKNCTFGIDTVETSTANLIEFGAASGFDQSHRTIFEGCLFIMNADAAGPTFLKVDAGAGEQVIFFKDCLFVNTGSSALTYGIDGAGLGNAIMVFDSGCSFVHGVTDVVAAAYEGYISTPHYNTSVATLKLETLLGVNPDVA